jgi:hypothetical protein
VGGLGLSGASAPFSPGPCRAQERGIAARAFVVDPMDLPGRHPRSSPLIPCQENPAAGSPVRLFSLPNADQVYTDSRTSLAPDGAMAEHLHDAAVPHFPPLTLSPEDKLDVLRHLDEFRFWHSLDDERRCPRCHETITGRQILVLERPGTRGRMRLQCPTPGCASASSEWVYLNPVLFATSQSSSASPQPSPHDNIRIANAKYRRSEKAEGISAHARRSASFRAALARLPVLRSIATSLHAIHPVP